MSVRIIRLFSFKQSPINCFAVLAYGPIYMAWDTKDTPNMGHFKKRGTP